MVAQIDLTDPELLKSFPRFDGSYYGVWHLAMKDKLTDLKLWDVIEYGEVETKQARVAKYYKEMLTYVPIDNNNATETEI